MILIHEKSRANRRNPAAAEKQKFLQAASHLNLTVHSIPSNWARASDAATVLKRVPQSESQTPGMLNGYIHPSEEYEELYEACLAKNIVLLNSPDEYARTHLFSEAWPSLRGITPDTVLIRDVSEVGDAIKELGLPVFIKGGVQSRKDLGWSHCVAKSPDEAARITGDLLDSYKWSEGVVAIRKLVALKNSGVRDDGFPIGREFRIFLFEHRVIAMGPYWPVETLANILTNQEEVEVCKVAIEASMRLGVPFVVIDVGQLESGEWIVIEPGEPQTAGFGSIPAEEILRNLITVLAGSSSR